jgi:hypothetical protein
MMISPFFQDLRSLYESELADLTFDSEGHDVLAKRLAEKRQQIAFLVGMMELSPEMVAVVFHRAFAFGLPAVMEDLLSREADEFPEWNNLSDSIEIAPWARDLADSVLGEPGGEWFLTVAAGLEYMAARPGAAAAGAAAEDDDSDDGDDLDEDDGEGQLDAGEQGGDARERREAADDWMADQGFDRKD